MRKTSIGNSRLAAGLALVLLGVAAAHGGDFHRWVDSDGNVHYTDAPPPASAKSRATAAEQEAAAREGEARAESEREAAEREAARRQRDRMLLESYTTVEEIERTRDRRLDGVDGEIGLAQHRVERARAQVKHYDNLLDKLPADNEHRAEMKRQRQEVRERLERRRKELAQLKDKRADMAARFERDIERFRELTADDDSE